MHPQSPHSTERCDECGRNPRLVRSDFSECEVIECPHRAQKTEPQDGGADHEGAEVD